MQDAALIHTVLYEVVSATRRVDVRRRACEGRMAEGCCGQKRCGGRIGPGVLFGLIDIVQESPIRLL